MSILLQVQSGEKRFGARELFIKASMAVEVGEHVGVIGPNGAGKTTLFKILAGKEELDAGEITRSNSLRMGYLEQEEQLNPDELAQDYISRLSGQPMWDLYQLAFGLGLSEQHLTTPITQLSGGYRMRCQLLAQIGKEPNLLLLDEPTNYLDLESLIVLEQFLAEYKGAFLLISHDREFLKRVTTHTLEIEDGEFTKFNGHIDDYFEQKRILQEQLQARAISVENRRKEILDFARRFGAKATKARQAQSKLKTLKKLEPIELKALPVQAKINIPEPTRTGKHVVTCTEVNLGYGDHTVLSNVDFQLVRGMHLGVVGVNGAGKSTFLKAVAGQLPALRGDIEHGLNVAIGYYSQHVAENLDLNQTVYEALAEVAHRDLNRQDIRNLAGQLLFSDERIDSNLVKMSGGEKARVALGRVLVQRNPLLVLDEPTNHLDFHTVEALTESLRSYPGSLIVVSHDRSFIGRIASQILEIKDGRAQFYPGTYQEYVWSLEKGIMGSRSEPTEPVEALKKDTIKENSPKSKEQKKKLRQELREKTKRLNSLEKKMMTLTKAFEEGSAKVATLTGEEANELMRNLAYKQVELEDIENDWMAAQEQIEKLEQELDNI